MNPNMPNQNQPPTGAAQPTQPVRPAPATNQGVPGYQQMQQTMPPMQVGGAIQPGVPGNPGVMPAGAPTNPNSTQNTLLIAEIRDGVVIMNDGTFRCVVQVKSINFDLMSPQEQEAVEYAYQGFINSLYFPVQIFVHSTRVDIQPYLERLDKIRSEHENMLLALLMEDYISFIDTLSQQANIMDKRFYVVIPFSPTVDMQKVMTQPKNFFSGFIDLFNNSKEQHVVINEADLEKAKNELRERTQAVLSGLMQCGVHGLPLDTQELIELYYDTYNPDTATRQQLKDINTMTADVVTKGEGAVSPEHLQTELPK